MAFNSLIFLIFFAVVLGLHSLPLRWQIKKTNLLLASYVFYAAWNPPFVLLLWISTLTDWFAARRIAREPTLTLCAQMGRLRAAGGWHMLRRDVGAHTSPENARLVRRRP